MEDSKNSNWQGCLALIFAIAFLLFCAYYTFVFEGGSGNGPEDMRLRPD
jgi:hypothetical protein